MHSHFLVCQTWVVLLISFLSLRYINWHWYKYFNILISCFSVIFFPPNRKTPSIFYSKQFDHFLSTMVRYDCWVKAVTDSKLIHLEMPWFLYPDTSLISSYSGKQHKANKQTKNQTTWEQQKLEFSLACRQSVTSISGDIEAVLPGNTCRVVKSRANGWSLPLSLPIPQAP